MLWLHKYKPTDLNQICGNKDIIKFVEKSINNKQDMILRGDNGIGKTLTVQCILKNKKINEASEIYMLNANDDTSIKMIRNNLTTFLKSKTVNTKYVLIKNIANLSTGSQHGLVGLMDVYKNAVFIIFVNSYENIIESLQSRCTLIEFNNIEEDERKEYITDILNKEEIKFDEDIFDTIEYYMNNNIRKTLLVLQNVVHNNRITSDDIIRCMKSPFHNTIEKIMEYTQQNKKYESMKEFRTLLSYGYNQDDIIKYMFQFCIDYPNMTEENKIKYLKCIGDVQLSINKGLYSIITLDRMIIQLCSIFI